MKLILYKEPSRFYWLNGSAMLSILEPLWSQRPYGATLGLQATVWGK